MCSKSLGRLNVIQPHRMDGTKSSKFSYFWRTSTHQGDEKLCEVKEEKVANATKNLTKLFLMWACKTRPNQEKLRVRKSSRPDLWGVNPRGPKNVH
ncbi:hypothetical protein H5410_001692 [Solanum commersonii]|uniref:Uncharacterized protein n=1 Tax=Solanum commersonii TaxID=4109 RepID=A0A9J6B0T1_SOLCO|nr:hypothetical protein H5410_001692 [Solanum commersonii]